MQPAKGSVSETVRSARAPAVHDPFRLPSDDPTLGEGVRAPTTPSWQSRPAGISWQSTPTGPEARDGSALVIGQALIDDGASDGEDSPVTGSGANIAVGLARLERSVTLMTSFGADAQGQRVSSYLEHEHVHVAQGSDQASRTSTTGSSAAQGDGPVPADLVWEPPAARPAQHPRVVHVGPVGVLQSGAATVARTIAAYRPAATITYNPRIWPDVMGSSEDVRAQVDTLVAQADVVAVRAEDLAWLYPDDEQTTAIGRWLAARPGIVFVTGAEGTFAVSALGVVVTARPRTAGSSPAVDVDDAFMIGLIDALWRGGLLGVAGRKELHSLFEGSLQALVDAATAAAELEAAQPGAGLPTRTELDAWRGIPGIAAQPLATGISSR